MDEDRLAPNAEININAILTAANRNQLGDGVVYVFRDVWGNKNSQLLRIYYDKLLRKGVREVVIEYEGNLDSSSPETFARALDDVRAFNPNVESWRLGFGGHGMGWLPPGVTRSIRAENEAAGGDRILTRSLLDDFEANKKMEYDALAGVIPDGMFDVIIFDLCYMGGIEFAYTLRDKADYLILSAAEVMAEGMPYDQVVPLLFEAEMKLGEGGVCEKFYEYYFNHSNQAWQYGTIALVDCSELEDFGETMRQVVAGANVAPKDVDINQLQNFDRNSRHTMFDMREFVYAMYPTDGDAMRTAFDGAMERLVVYHKTTGKPLGDPYNTLTIPVDRFCGLSSYVPVESNGGRSYADLNEAYAQTEWFKKVYPQP
jgi:hypothetical protein